MFLYPFKRQQQKRGRDDGKRDDRAVFDEVGKGIFRLVLMDEMGEHDARQSAGWGQEGPDVAADDGGVNRALVHAEIREEDAHRDVVDEVGHEKRGEPISPDGVRIAKPSGDRL